MPKSTAQAQAGAQTAGNRPVYTLRHRRIKATIWRNETEKGPMFNVTVVRSYKDDSDQWHDVGSFGYDDLMNVSALMYEAHAYISSLIARERAPRKGKDGDIPY